MSSGHLMCGAHWRLVPPGYQLALYTQRPGTPNHRIAVLGAVLAVAREESNTAAVMLVEKLLAS